MNLAQLTIRSHGNGFALVADIGKPTEHVVASRIHDEASAKILRAAPELASAAIFAVQMLNAQGTDSVLQMAYVKLVNALVRAGIDMNVGIATQPPTAQEEEHPDTRRLNHLIKWDRAQGGRIEKIEFVFENPTSDPSPDVVRAAIDNSIQALERFEAKS